MAKQSDAAAKPKAPRVRRVKAPADTASPIERAMDAAIIPLIKGMPTADDIRIRAYHLYLERGATSGFEVDDWVRAEAELQDG